MDISVIIVNYNVKHFLEQCLHALMRSARNLDTEVIVVDNHSVDGSCQMVREKFPQVRLIENKTNEGFARANNQGIRTSAGNYILLLNPDTVVQEDTLALCLGFMQVHPEAGCLGVRMIDGRGNFLPESRRALPTPAVAFYKIFGLSSLFPKSRIFGRYHLGHLDRDSIHEADVIAGAFMFIRKSALEKTGLLDERFFMYGEDIDLSYRMKMNGYRNYYFPLTTIIHYKGESTRKSSMNYVILFYKAMILFASKHFSKRTAFLYTMLIRPAIYFRASLTILMNALLSIINPLLDAVLIYSGYRLFLPVWENHIFGIGGTYPPVYMNVVVPAYIAVWLLSLYLAGGYEKLTRLISLIKGILTGSLIILVIYALLPESFRFSRLMILAGTVWAILSVILSRLFLGIIRHDRFRLEMPGKKKRIVIIGGPDECDRAMSIVRQHRVNHELAGYVSADETEYSHPYIGKISSITEIVQINRVDEIIFCSSDLRAQQIIETMLLFNNSDVEFKIAPPESISIIGSSSAHAPGELYVLHFNTLSVSLNRKKKRLLDIVVSLILLSVSPFSLFIVHQPTGYLRNVFLILSGKATWVGYYRTKGGNHPGLPSLRIGVITPVDSLSSASITPELAEKYNLMYAKDYRVLNDINMIIRSFRHLGRNPFRCGSDNQGKCRLQIRQ